MISFIIPSQDTSTETVASIQAQNIPGHQILIMGGTDKITVKFNKGVEKSINHYVCWIRDYMVLDPDWFKNAIWDYDVCMNRILNPDGTRFRDWCSWDDPEIRPEPWIQREVWCGTGLFWPAKAAMVPYSYNKTDRMYVSGSYLLGRRDFLRKFPMDYTLDHLLGEDVEWSIRARKHWNYQMNYNQVVRLLKYKDPIIPEVK